MKHGLLGVASLAGIAGMALPAGCDRDANDRTDTGQDVAVAGDAAGETCTGMLFIDFPCQPESYSQCESATTYRTWETKGCADLGYDPRCCAGLTCVLGTVRDCPEGTVCDDAVYTVNPCRPIECGRPQDPACPEEAFCEQSAGDCEAGTGGWCRSRAECDPLEVAGDGRDWVCGCDDLSYPDDCRRRAAGVGLRDDGPCCDPAKLQIDPANPEGFTHWLVCGTGDAGLLAAARHLDDDPHVRCVQASAGTAMGCDDGEWACRGTMMLWTDGSILHLDEICRLTGLPGVRRVVGTTVAE